MNKLSGIFIDDAGTPGVKPPSKFLPESRKSWCSVVIPSKISSDVATAMSILTDGVKSDYNAEELHFTDIYSGRGPWDSVGVTKRIEVFDFMNSIVEGFSLPVFYQTWSKESKNDHRLTFKSYEKLQVDFWNLQRVDHYGLILLLIRTRKGIEELRNITKGDFDESFQIYVDEGIAKSGSSFKVPCESESVFEEKLNFVSSKSNLGIQIADFAAFVISRSQWLMFKKKEGTGFSKADKHILSINEKLNHWSLEFCKVDERSFSRELLESFLMRDRQNKKLTPIPKS
jgi:hypothetical protein